MFHAGEAALRRGASVSAKPASVAGFGAIAFGILTTAALVVINPPGSSYARSDVTAFLTRRHEIVTIVFLHLALFGLLGLVSLLAQLRDVAAPAGGRAAGIGWGAGIASVAATAAGWAIVGGQAIAHLEGGKGLVVNPPVTHMLSEVGVVFIFGSGSILLGCALLVLLPALRSVFPKWLSRFTALAALCAIRGPRLLPVLHRHDLVGRNRRLARPLGVGVSSGSLSS